MDIESANTVKEGTNTELSDASPAGEVCENTEPSEVNSISETTDFDEANQVCEDNQTDGLFDINEAAEKQCNGQYTTVVSVRRQGKVESAVVNIIALLALFSFGYIAIMSFIQISVIDPEEYGNEIILYQLDNILLNILFTALFAFVLFRLKKHCNFFAKVNMAYMEIGIVFYTIVLGLIWILSVTSVPASDSYNLFEAATKAADGDYSFLQNGAEFFNKDYYDGYSYFNFYPFQLGFVLISELVYRLFGTATALPMQFINVICLGAAYLGIAKITKYIFKRRSIEFFAILLLAGCIQPVLFCSFVYGNIIGMCCAIWASFFLIRYFRTNKYTYLIPCAVLLVLSVLVKYNNMIYVIAFAVVLVLHTISMKKWQSIAFALAICIASVGSIQLVILSYEARGEVEISDGVSQVLYLDMGLSDSPMAPGWYTSVAKDIYSSNGLDSKAANAEGWRDIDTKLRGFGNSFEYTLDFFSKKILSQWNEPTYESIWISKVKDHYFAVNAIGNSVYDGSFGQLLELYFNFYMQILFLLFAGGICFLVIKRQTDIEAILFPLVMLGGFGYHLLFEGKSQYILTYIVLMIPTAAYAVNCLYKCEFTKIKAAIAKINSVPNEANKETEQEIQTDVEEKEPQTD